MSAPEALRQAVMPRSAAIARSHAASSISVSTCGPLLSVVPLPLMGVVCSWLECVDLLRLFRVNRTFVAIHHRPSRTSPASSSSSSPSSYEKSEWVAVAWSHSRQRINANHDCLFVEQVKAARTAQHSDFASRWAPVFPDIDESEQPAHLCRLSLAATPYLRHLRILHNTRRYGHMADMADTLDMLPTLHTLVLYAEADDCTDLERLFIPLREVLARHPRLHAFQCDGCADISLSDILAIGSHPALAHISVSGDLHSDNEAEEIQVQEVQLDFSSCPEQEDMERSMWLWFEWDRDDYVDAERAAFSRRPCAGCTSSSVTARLGLLRHVQEKCIADNDEFELSGGGAQIARLIGELEQSEAACSSEELS